MADLEEALGRRAGMMTHQEVIQQYFKVFGREMTQTERDAFFLPHWKSLHHEENDCWTSNERKRRGTL
jgi:hypothetical protein